MTWFGRPSAWPALVALFAIVGTRGDAQQLPVKRTLSAASALPCPAPPPGLTASRNDSPDVRRLMALGHEAAIVGDSRQARDAFVDAAELSPRDERIAYQLGRAYEELGERPNAVREYCRFLALAPQSGDAADVRARITALAAPTGSNPAGDPASAAFKAGVDHLASVAGARRPSRSVARSRRSRARPKRTDRGLALAALDQRDDAVRDLEQYLAIRPNAEDQAQVRAQIDALRKPTWSAGTALLTGLLVPGLGQVYTSRPWIGVGVAAVAGSALYLALYSTEEQEIRDFSVTIPGFPPIPNLDTVTVTKHPYQPSESPCSRRSQ